MRLDYVMPSSRGLIGFQSEFRTMTSGSGILVHTFDHYGPVKKVARVRRPNGALVSMAQGKALGFAHLQPAGARADDDQPGRRGLRGQIVGINARD